MTLREYLDHKNWKPYSKKNDLAERLGISNQHVGDIARGIRRPSPELALRIEEATDNKVTMREMFEFYTESQDCLRTTQRQPNVRTSAEAG